MKKRMDPWLIGIVILSFFLQFFRVWEEGYGNTYYAVAVKSMLQNFHAFFYASYDPAGFVTVDKPPVSLWVQTAFAYVFGFKGWAIILPSILAGVASVSLMYFIMKPRFGARTARLASLILAVTPVFVAVNRTNNMDPILLLLLMTGTWALFKSVREKKWKYLLLASAMVGIGFNAKMLQAFMVLPAFYLFYLIAAKYSLKMKLMQLVPAVCILLVVSLSWGLYVDSVPADQRPYIGSSETNSVMDLAFGYNGAMRLLGRDSGGSGGTPPSQSREGSSADTAPPNARETDDSDSAASASNVTTEYQHSSSVPSKSTLSTDQGERQSPQNGQPMNRPTFTGGRGAGGGGFNLGEAGVFRLFNASLGGQASWFLPFVLLASIGIFQGVWRRRLLNNEQKEAMFWYAWLLPVAAFFSIAGFFHEYYLTMLAPAIAALTAIGWMKLYGDFKDAKRGLKWLLPCSVVVTGLTQAYLIENTGGNGIFAYVIGGVSVAVGLILIGIQLKRLLSPRNLRLASSIAMFLLLIAPFYWSMTPILYGDNSKLPVAGPTLNSPGGFSGSRGQQTMTEDIGLMKYLEEHYDGETYIVAAQSHEEAAPIQLATDHAVMTMGGYSGSDSILTVDELASLAESGEITYFYISSGGSGGRGRGGQSSELTNWIMEHTEEVPQSEWKDETESTSNDSASGSMSEQGNSASVGRSPAGFNNSNKLYVYTGERK
ncbi:glycosyltransferase family 39 protein [Paenibacillus sp. Marseille-Q4541]|uniref:ArnT family glycosyltransferase n=1 Tax=Paenibacillus sp. Marseille-Q4541 TaxID=2831522 RepID=UPI001BA9D7DF|nr:glycosyltransferase family 39 protein [Paenibacillus sp. Marseille-Q4541]